MRDKINNLAIVEIDLSNELSRLVEQSQQQIIVQSNAALTLLFLADWI